MPPLSLLRLMSYTGGEKQRLAMSRVLLKDPPILFFDEAVSMAFLPPAPLHGLTTSTRHLHSTRTPNKPS